MIRIAEGGANTGHIYFAKHYINHGPSDRSVFGKSYERKYNKIDLYHFSSVYGYDGLRS